MDGQAPDTWPLDPSYVAGAVPFYGGVYCDGALVDDSQWHPGGTAVVPAGQSYAIASPELPAWASQRHALQLLCVHTARFPGMRAEAAAYVSGDAVYTPTEAAVVAASPPQPVRPTFASFFTTNASAVGYAPSQVASADRKRQYLLVQNNDAADTVMVYFGNQPNGGGNWGVQIPPGGNYELNVKVPWNQVWCAKRPGGGGVASPIVVVLG